MANKQMMQCGHEANAHMGEEHSPCCAICAGIDPRAYIPMGNSVDLSQRFAVCPYCKSILPSSTPGLAFFEYRADKGTDRFYCGCRGWD